MLPPGLSNPQPIHCCKLIKSLYGIKQTSQKWYKKLSLLLQSCGHQQAQADHNLFVKSSGSNFTTLIVYVDDIVLTGNFIDEIDRIKKVLDDTFQIKNLVVVLLGFRGSLFRKGDLSVSKKYCLYLLQDSGFLGSKPCSAPMDTDIRLHQDSSQEISDVSFYWRLVGRLLTLQPLVRTLLSQTQHILISRQQKGC